MNFCEWGTSCSPELCMKNGLISGLYNCWGTGEHFSQIYPLCIERIIFREVSLNGFRKKIFFYKIYAFFVPQFPTGLI